jgi:AraC family transcriptional regulator
VSNQPDPAQSVYRARFRTVLDYIDGHLADDVSLAQLADVASSSKFHFARQFSALYGCSVYSYVQSQRLKHAGELLAFRVHMSVLQIALESGYQSPESFARVFKSHTGQSPSQFREQPNWECWNETNQLSHAVRSQYMSPKFALTDVAIVTTSNIAVAVFEHRGDPKCVGDSVRSFIAWRRDNGLSPSVSATYNILYDNPDETAAEDYRFDLCASVPAPIAANTAGIVNKIIPGGRCATIRHIGDADGAFAAVHFLYRQWLPQSGETLRDFPVYVQRVKFHPDVTPNQAITDVFLPLA